MKPVLLSLLLIGLRSPLFAQSLDSVVTLSQRTLTVRAVLEQLDSGSHYTFSYSNRLPLDTTLTLPTLRGPLRTFLDYIRQQQDIQYRVVDDKILFFRRRATGSLPEKVTLSGYLTDAATGERLMGATIYAEDAEVGAVSNRYGYYALPVTPGEYTVAVSFVGYQSQRVPVLMEENQTLNLGLATDNVQLNEVIVSASGPVPKVHEREMSTVQLDMSTVRKMPSFIDLRADSGGHVQFYFLNR